MKDSWAKFSKAMEKGVGMHFVAGFRHKVKRGPSCKMHAHPTFEIVFHRTGEGTTRSRNGRPIAFGEHDAIIYGPNVEHDQHMDTTGEDICVQLTPSTKRTRCPDGVFHVAAIADTIVIEEILSLSVSQAASDKAQQALLNHRASAVMLALLRQPMENTSQKIASTGKSHTAAAAVYILRNYATIRSLREVAEQTNLSLDHLRHLFSQEYKQSMIAYLTEARISRSKFLLRNTGLPLKQIATMVGYENEYYFSKVFRRQVGTPPATYRRN